MFSKPEPALVFDETLTLEEEQLYLVGIDLLGDNLAYACLRKDAEPRAYPTKPQIVALQLSREPSVASLTPRSPSLFSRSSSSRRKKQHNVSPEPFSEALLPLASLGSLGSLGSLEAAPSLTSSSILSTPPSSIVSFKKWRKQELKLVPQSVPQEVPAVPAVPQVEPQVELVELVELPDVSEHRVSMGPPLFPAPPKPQSLRASILQDSLKGKLIIRERPSVDLARKIDRPVSLAYTPGAYWRMSGVDQSHLGAMEATQIWKRSKKSSESSSDTGRSNYETSSWGIITPEDSVSNVNSAQSRGGGYDDYFDFELPEFDPTTERLNRRPIVL